MSPEAPLQSESESAADAGPREEPAAGPRESLSASVIIPTYRRERILVETIESVLAQDPPALEVIVVDQTPKHEPETSAALEALVRADKIRWLREKIANVCRARNIGAALARGEILVFLDDDILCPPGLLARHVETLAAAPDEVWAVSGRCVLAPEELDREIPHLFPPETAADRWGDISWRASVALDDAPYALGANSSYRRARFIEANGLNERMGRHPFGEEVDLGLRIRKAGGRIVFAPRAAVVHRAMESGGSRAAAGRWFSFARYRERSWYYLIFRRVPFGSALRHFARRTRQFFRRAFARLGLRKMPPEELPPTPGLTDRILAGGGGRLTRALKVIACQILLLSGALVGFLEAIMLSIRDCGVTGHYEKAAAEVAARAAQETAPPHGEKRPDAGSSSS